jgi:hypothetical protein
MDSRLALGRRRQPPRRVVSSVVAVVPVPLGDSVYRVIDNGAAATGAA